MGCVVFLMAWWMGAAAFAGGCAVVHYGFDGSLLGAPTWAWGLMCVIATYGTFSAMNGKSA